MTVPSPQLELCSGTYRVYQTNSDIVIFGHGVPGGPVLQALTPFQASASFQSTRNLAHACTRTRRPHTS
jgi:hypothetical protein